MPYLHSRIADKHKARCKNPKSKRLYIRDYDEDTKKRIFTPLGIFCPSCKVIIFDSEPLSAKSLLNEDLEAKAEAQTQVNTKPRPKPKPEENPQGVTLSNKEKKTIEEMITGVNKRLLKSSLDSDEPEAEEMPRMEEIEETPQPQPPEQKPVLKLKPKPSTPKQSEAELKEMAKYGTVVECCVCHKSIIAGTCVVDTHGIFGRTPKFSKEIWDKYGLNGSLCGWGVQLYNPDRKRVDMKIIPLDIQPFACSSCRKKHFKNDTTPFTEEAWKACTIPYPEDKPEPVPQPELKPEIAISRPPVIIRRGKRYNKRKKIVAGFAASPNVITDCIICNQPTTSSYDSLEAMASDEGQRYGGERVGWFYPNGKRVHDYDQRLKSIRMKEQGGLCCYECRKKHFEQSLKNPNRQRGEPITALAKKVITERCTIPFPIEIIS